MYYLLSSEKLPVSLNILVIIHSRLGLYHVSGNTYRKIVYLDRNNCGMVR